MAFHYCAALGAPPAWGRVPKPTLLRHVALSAADVPLNLHCRYQQCRPAQEALDHHRSDGTDR